MKNSGLHFVSCYAPFALSIHDPIHIVMLSIQSTNVLKVNVTKMNYDGKQHIVNNYIACPLSDNLRKKILNEINTMDCMCFCCLLLSTQELTELCVVYR